MNTAYENQKSIIEDFYKETERLNNDNYFTLSIFDPFYKIIMEELKEKSQEIGRITSNQYYDIILYKFEHKDKTIYFIHNETKVILLVNEKTVKEILRHEKLTAFDVDNIVNKNAIKGWDFIPSYLYRE